MTGSAVSVPPVDPNWLLSSMAQSAAALVAIVGGLLVSRLVTLSSERGSIIQRKREVDARRRIKEAEHEEIRADRFAVCYEWFLKHHRDNLMDKRGNVDIGAMLADFIPRGSSEEEMRPVAEHLAGKVKDAFTAIEGTFDDKLPPESSQELSAGGVAVPDDDKDVLRNGCATYHQ